MPDTPAYFDAPLPTGGTLREALRAQALNTLFYQSVQETERHVDQAIEFIKTEKNDA